MEDTLWDFIEALFWKAPVYLTLFGGAVFALARYERHPAASLWAAAGFGWLFVMHLAAAAWRVFAVPELFPDPPPPTSLPESLSYVTVSALESVGYVLLLVAL